ncbi:MAG: LppM family (lipo)protein, partial [Acidimicrobiales bacterium]
MAKRLILLAALAAIVTAGCIRVDFTIDVQEDGTGTMEGITAFDFESFGGLLENLDDAGIPGQGDLCAEFENDLGIDEGEFDEVKPYTEDGFCGVEFKTSFDADEFDTVVGGVNTGGGTIERQGDGWYFELPLDDSDFDTSDAEFIPGFEDILGDAAYIVRVRLPGEQVEHNGEIDGDGFVVWDIDVTNPPEKLFLRTEPGETQTGEASVGQAGSSDDGGGSAVGVVIIVLIVLAGLGVAAYFLMRSRSNNTSESPDAGPTATAPLAPPVDPNAPPQDYTGPTT